MKNGSQNSRIEILLGVIRNLLDDIANLIESSATLRVNNILNVRRECVRDFEYILSRANHEGLSFLTCSMPRLGKWYDSILSRIEKENDSDTGEYVIPCGFKPHCNVKREDLFGDFSCPVFCRMLAYVIHDTRSSLRDRARIIRAYRTLFYLYYKLEIPLTEEQLKTALQVWKDNESDLASLQLPDYYHEDLCRARELIAYVLGDARKAFTDFTPRHGPGAVAGGEDNIAKWDSANYIPSLHRVYPRYDVYFGFRSGGRISSAMCGEIISFVKRSREQRAISRLLFVPKDSRGPRTISCEPKELMFLQQGVSRNLMRNLHAFSHGRINFVDQDVNGMLALTSSETGQFATIDLKDASDRVTTDLVLALFPEEAHRYLLALRSESTLLPDGSLFEGHRKYAPMGSALCFPIESAVFWALAVVAGIRSGMSAPDAIASTYVYGDDIIIRPQVFTPLCELFTRCGLLVNKSKSYVDGPFRESCGVDAWNGKLITPFKIKKDISRRSPDGNLAAAICEYCSTCYSLDYRATGDYLLNLVNAAYPGILVHDTQIGGLSVVDPCRPINLSDYKHGFDRRLCRVWVEGWVLTSPKEPVSLDGLSRLLRAYYGSWEEHDPSVVAVLRSAKIRKRKILVEI